MRVRVAKETFVLFLIEAPAALTWAYLFVDDTDWRPGLPWRWTELIVATLVFATEILKP